MAYDLYTDIFQYNADYGNSQLYAGLLWKAVIACHMEQCELIGTTCLRLHYRYCIRGGDLGHHRRFFFVFVVMHKTDKLNL